MKLEKVESVQPHSIGRYYSCFLYVSKGHHSGDSIFVGCEDGSVCAYHLQKNNEHISGTKEEVFAAEGLATTRHSAYVSCLMHSTNAKLTSTGSHGESIGVLFSGSRDGTVKAWNSSGQVIQTLPHSSSVICLADSFDGSMLSICVDGYLRMWAPQPGREMMLNPFYECVCSISVVNPLDGWISALAVNPIGRLTVFLGEGDGSISLYKKPVRDLNASDKHNALSQNMMKRHDRWDKIHRLGVTALYSLPNDGFLISLSTDCTCKVLDQVLGHTLYSMENKSKCVFTGLQLMSDTQFFLLPDELGQVHKFHMKKERIIDVTTLVKANRVRKDKILTLHQDQLLGEIQKFRNLDNFLVFMKPTQKREKGLSIEPMSVLHKHDVFAEGGEIALWKNIDSEDVDMEFIGHHGQVVGLGVFNVFDHPEVESLHDGAASSSGLKKKRKPKIDQGNDVVFQVSKEEMVLFSVASDRSIRCWDEFDGKEAYQFKTKTSADMVSMHMLWSTNSLATGHEDGTITLWNIDAGTYVTSNVTQQPLTCIIEARNSKSHILVTADFSGRIVLWNLTLFRLNPKQLPLEAVVKGHHDPEESSILSLAFHASTNTFFSGGSDRQIVAFRMDSLLHCARYQNNHKSGVCALQCSKHYLVSGDEAGEVVLWGIDSVLDGDARSTGTATGERELPRLTKLIRWYGLNHSSIARSVVSMREMDEERLFVLQAHDGYERTAVLWKVWCKKVTIEDTRDSAGGYFHENVSKIDIHASAAKKAEVVNISESLGVPIPQSKGVPTTNAQEVLRSGQPPFATQEITGHTASLDLNQLSSGSLGSQGGRADLVVRHRAHDSPTAATVSSTGCDQYPPRQDEQFRILVDSTNLDVAVFSAGALTLDGDVSCAEIGLSDDGNSIRALYFGTSMGPLYKSSQNIEKNFGEN